MEKLFGLEMTIIATCLGSSLALVLAVLALLAWRGRVMFKLGIRPIGRRRAQSALIVLGLMLATLIITAAFFMGDTLSHTIRSLTLDALGEIDELVRLGSGRAGNTGQTYFKLARFEELDRQIDPDLVDMAIPVIQESIPVVNVTRRQSERSLRVLGLRPEDTAILEAGERIDAAGESLYLEDLGPREVYLNAAAAEDLDAMPGDKLELYTESQPTFVYVRAVATGGENASMFLSLQRAQSLFNQPGQINTILISNVGDASAGAELSQPVTVHLRGLLTDSVIASRIFNQLTSDANTVSALRAAAADRRGNLQQDLTALAAGLAAGVLDDELLSLLADEGLTDEVQIILREAGWRNEPARDRLGKLFTDLSELEVNDVKRDNLDQGELAASAFTTIFIVTGLFGIAAGLLLIFLIFVLLAAERKPEMGMTRAVGGQRHHLVQMFVFEGTAYDLAAAGVGVGLGIVTGYVLAASLGQAFAAQSDLTIQPYLTLRSLVVSYSLGMLMTFGTVVFAAYRVSKLNIVAAIRDLPEPPPPPSRLVDRLLAPLRVLGEGFRHLRKLRIGRAVWAFAMRVPLSLLGVVWAGFISGPLTLLLGLALTPTGAAQSSGALFTIGGSFLIIGGCLTLRHPLRLAFRRRPALVDRIIFTLMGLGLVIFWSVPSDFFEPLGVKNLKTGPEMLFISGILLVAGAVMVVMYNTELLLQIILRLSGGARRLAPVLRMSIAYPMANRFRTGLTMGMFAVVVFSVVFMATAFKVNEAFFEDTDALTGGFDLRTETSRTNPVPDLEAAIASSRDVNRKDYEVVAARSGLGVEARQDRGRWGDYLIWGLDENYLDNIGFELAVIAEGYESAAEVWRAVRNERGFAVIDSYGVPSQQTTNIVIGGPDFKLDGVYIEDETMPPLTVEVRDPFSEAIMELTVIGVIEQGSFLNLGLFTSQRTLDRELPYALAPTTHFIKLAEDLDPEAAGIALESAFVKHGLQSIDQVAELKDAQASQRVIEVLLQGFLTLGLVVGVAALGVVSTRAVVERRQQIGMLRALGFQREMVSWSFMIESSVVALLGIGLGTVLALIPAYHMITEMAQELPSIKFQVPWSSIALVVGLAYGMALLATWLPARQAALVTPAEALRYE
jgi:putative ABC transport system permease protein